MPIKEIAIQASKYEGDGITNRENGQMIYTDKSQKGNSNRLLVLNKMFIAISSHKMQVKVKTQYQLQTEAHNNLEGGLNQLWEGEESAHKILVVMYCWLSIMVASIKFNAFPFSWKGHFQDCFL